jgi:AcrR family transcriptional regulator
MRAVSEASGNSYTVDMTDLPDKPVRQRAKRRTPDLDSVLDVTVELLLEHGEAGFRIEEVIDRTGISKSSLYLHFGGRDGLIESACLEIFSRQVTSNIDATIRALESVETPQQMRELVPALVDIAIYDTPDDVRWNRVMMLAAAHSRPRLYEELGKAQMRLNGALTEAVTLLQERGVVVADVQSSELALLLQIVSFGRVFRDLDPSMGSRNIDEWRRMTIQVFESFILP